MGPKTFVSMGSSSFEERAKGLNFDIGALCALASTQVDHFGPSPSEIRGTPRTTHFSNICTSSISFT